MAKVIPIGQPANESERQAIGFLRDHLPDGWLIFHNFEMRQGERCSKSTSPSLRPHAVYLVDVKGTRGNIDVYGSKWYPEGRQKFHSPAREAAQSCQGDEFIIWQTATKALSEAKKSTCPGGCAADG